MDDRRRSCRRFELLCGTLDPLRSLIVGTIRSALGETVLLRTIARLAIWTFGARTTIAPIVLTLVGTIAAIETWFVATVIAAVGSIVAIIAVITAKTILLLISTKRPIATLLIVVVAIGIAAAIVTVVRAIVLTIAVLTLFWAMRRARIYLRFATARVHRRIWLGAATEILIGLITVVVFRAVLSQVEAVRTRHPARCARRGI